MFSFSHVVCFSKIGTKQLKSAEEQLLNMRPQNRPRCVSRPFMYSWNIHVCVLLCGVLSLSIDISSLSRTHTHSLSLTHTLDDISFLVVVLGGPS